MIRKKVTVQDYLEIAKEHKTFIWHFLQKDQCDSGCLSFFSYFDDSQLKNGSHPIRDILNVINIPYFESLTEESVDFLIANGVPSINIWRFGNFNPIILGFRDGVVVTHSGLKCYCPESLIEMIAELDPNLLLSIEEKYLK